MPRRGPAFMQKETRTLRWWLAAGAAGAELGRFGVATAAGDGDGEGEGEGEGEVDGSAFGEGLVAAGEGTPAESATRWPAAVAATVSAAARVSLADARCAAAGSARSLAPASTCAHCQRVAMPTISASLSAASTEGQVQSAHMGWPARNRTTLSRGASSQQRLFCSIKSGHPAKSARQTSGLLHRIQK
eukprot:scaffold51180_cov75-Phaeocystis_antarctica.AAC.2